MLAAATAWDGLAAVLNSAAVSYAAVVSGLTHEAWMGPASASMAAAAAPFAGWLSAVTEQAQQTAIQANTAAAAFETAFAMVVPPPLIEANRSQLMSLVTTNLLGLNTPAIEALQADYAEMWAQDAAAMYQYSAASEAASTLTPFTQPAQTADPTGTAVQATEAASGTGTSTSAAGGDVAATPSATPAGIGSDAPIAPLTSESSAPAASIVVPTPIGDLDIVATYIAVVATTSMSLAIVNTARPWNFTHGNTANGGIGPTQGTAVDEEAPRTSGSEVLVSAPIGGGAPVSAGVGHAALLGALSVPHSWTTAAPEIKLAVESLPSASFSAAPQADFGGVPTGLLSGMALASLAARGAAGGTGARNSNDASDEEGQPNRKPTVVVIQKPPPAEGPLGHRPS